MDDGCALTAPARLCFLVEERYENHVMPGAVVDMLRSWGHHVDVLRPHGMLADLGALMPSPLDAAGAAGLTTVNDHRAIRLARDKAVAVVQRSPLHPGADVVETADGWVVLDVNDFPSFGTLPEAAARAATTLTFAPLQEATA